MHPYLSHIAASDADDFGAGPDCGNVLGRLLRLLDVAADDAGIGSQADQRPRLHAADGACAARHKDNAVLCVVSVSLC